MSYLQTSSLTLKPGFSELKLTASGPGCGLISPASNTRLPTHKIIFFNFNTFEAFRSTGRVEFASYGGLPKTSFLLGNIFRSLPLPIDKALALLSLGLPAN